MNREEGSKVACSVNRSLYSHHRYTAYGSHGRRGTDRNFAHPIGCITVSANPVSTRWTGIDILLVGMSSLNSPVDNQTRPGSSE